MKVTSLSAAIGRRLHERRVSAGLSASLLARRSGLTAAVLRGIEEGTSAPSVGQLGRVAAQLGVSLADVVRKAKSDGAPVASHAASPVASRAWNPKALGRAIVELPDDGRDKLNVVEAAAVAYALELAGGNKSEAARLLGLKRQRFTRRIRRFRGIT